MQLWARRAYVGRTPPRTVCMIILLKELVAATATIKLPLNSQYPPVARVSIPFSFTLLESTSSSDGVLAYTLSNAPSWLSFNSTTRTLSGIPPDSAADVTLTVDIVATDGTETVRTRPTIIVTSSPAPKVAIPIEQQLSTLGQYLGPNSLLLSPSTRFSFRFNKDTFTYNGTSTGLSMYAIATDNTPLPHWVAFDNATMTFSGVTPDSESIIQLPGPFGIQLIASEIFGFAGISVPFYILVENHKLEWDTTVFQIEASIGMPVEFRALSGALKLDGEIANTSKIVSATITGAPEWLKFDNATYIIYGTPQELREDTSRFNVTVSVRDRYGATATAIIHVTLTRTVFIDEDIASLNATIGEPFAYNISQALIEPSAANVAISISSAVTWLLFDSESLMLSGTVPRFAKMSSINITITATSKFTMSGGVSRSKTLIINVVSLCLISTSVVQNSVVGTEVPKSNLATTEAATITAVNDLKEGLSPGEIAATAIVSMVVLFLATTIILYCWRRFRRLQSPNHTFYPLSKRNISKPELQKTISIIGLNSDREAIHPGLRPPVMDVNEYVHNSVQLSGITRRSVAAQQSVTSPGYSSNLFFRSGSDYRGHALQLSPDGYLLSNENYCPAFDSIKVPEAPATDNTDLFIMKKSTSESNEENLSHNIIASPSAIRTNGGAYSYHPYHTRSRKTNFQVTPEVVNTTNVHKYRGHKRHCGPNNQGVTLDIPRKQNNCIGDKRSASAPSEKNTDHNWETIQCSPNKCSSASPSSSMSVITESTDVLYLDPPSPASTPDKGSPWKSTFVTTGAQLSPIISRRHNSPQDAGAGNNSPSLSRPLSRRGAGLSPFFSGSGRMTSRVGRFSLETLKECVFRDNEAAVPLKDVGVAVIEPRISQEVYDEVNAAYALRDLGRGHQIDGIGNIRLDATVGGACTSSVEMTVESTRQLLSFVASVEKRGSWASDEDSRSRSTRLSFSGWVLDQESDNANAFNGEGLYRVMSYERTTSEPSIATSRRESIWYADESQDARLTALSE